MTLHPVRDEIALDDGAAPIGMDYAVGRALNSQMLARGARCHAKEQNISGLGGAFNNRRQAFLRRV